MIVPKTVAVRGQQCVIFGILKILIKIKLLAIAFSKPTTSCHTLTYSKIAHAVLIRE